MMKCHAARLAILVLLALLATACGAAPTPTVENLGDGRVRITATATNEGFLPTHLTVRGLVGRQAGGSVADQVQRPPEFRITLVGATLVEGDVRQRIPHLAGAEPFTGGAAERSRSVSWVVRPDRADATVRIVLNSDTGGRRTVELRLP
jgi:hypothetical protein